MNKYELLSNFDLIELGELMNLKLNVVPKDTLVKSNIKYDGYIINLDNSNGQGGTHWVALYIDNKNACYFDSFGEEPPLQVIRFCSGMNLIFSDFIIQNINQIACGYYCLAFLHYMNFVSNNKNIRYKLNNFIKIFDLENSNLNDNILQQYFKNFVRLK